MQRSVISVVRFGYVTLSILFLWLAIRHIIDFRTAIIGMFCTLLLGTLLTSLQGKFSQKSAQPQPFSESVQLYVDTLSVAITADGYVGSLVTASSTTGWFDWIHGEVWIFPQGLLRIPCGLGKTLTHMAGPTVDRQQLKAQLFHHEQFHQLLAKKSNLWIPREQITRAYLHQGLSTDRLRLVLLNGRSVKLLWLPVDNAFPVLQKVFTDWLGNELVIE